MDGVPVKVGSMGGAGVVAVAIEACLHRAQMKDVLGAECSEKSTRGRNRMRGGIIWLRSRCVGDMQEERRGWLFDFLFTRR